MDDNFYMVLHSTSSAIFPNNVANHFQVDCSPIYLEGNWELALYELSFRGTPTINVKNTIITYWRMTTKVYPCVFKFKCASDYHSFKFIKEVDPNLKVSIKNERLYLSSTRGDFKLVFENLKDANFFGFTTTSNKSTNGKLVGTNASLVGDVQSNAEIQYEKFTDLKFTFRHNLNSLTDLRDYIRNHCSDIFKFIYFENGVFRLKTYSDIYKVIFDPVLGNALGLPAIEYRKRGQKIDIVSFKKTDAKHMYIYTNMIEPIIVGDVKAPLLKSMWFKDRTSVVERPMYLPVACSRINNIEIIVRDDSGSFINFRKNTVLSITVHFRKNGG